MEIDTEAVWRFVPDLSKAEGLVLLGFARCWAQGGNAAEFGRLDPEPIAEATGVALATVSATLRKFTEPSAPSTASAGIDLPPLVEPVYYLATAEGRMVPDRRVGYRPAMAIATDQPQPERVDPAGPDDVPSFLPGDDAEG